MRHATKITDLRDVIVIGGGIAGLVAASEFGRSGLSVSILEGRDRIGGRILTLRDPENGGHIELGAEFIHGYSREIWAPLREAGVNITEVDGESWCVSDHRLAPCNSFSQIDSVLEKMDDSLPDESFRTFLDRCFPGSGGPQIEQVKQRALGYVSGFNAADPARVGVHWLVHGSRADERIQGHRSFRARNGYEDLLTIFQKRIAKHNIIVYTRMVVDAVQWRSGHIEVFAHGPDGSSVFKGRGALITLPLAVLKAPLGEPGAVHFMPALPPTKIAAMEKLEIGHVVRVVLRFRRRFWDQISPDGGATKTLSNMSFLFSQDPWLPTWWTTMPEQLPIITGWAPFRSAERLAGLDRFGLIQHSLRTLARLLGVAVERVESLLADAHFHDWEHDPFSRGAYSYGAVGADGAQQALGSPMENTLFFAGEATDVTGHNGTVHGAMASAYRAVSELLHGL